MKWLRKAKRVLAREDGVTLVEMGICSSALMAMLLGIFQLSVAIYSFNFVADAAREGSRFAMVRGSNCALNLSAAYCSPTDAGSSGATGNDVSSFVKSLNYPGHSQLSVSTSWLTASSTTPVTWSACGTPPCNLPGNQVQVTVSYNYQLNIPFVRSLTIPLSSTSQETIAQ